MAKKLDFSTKFFFSFGNFAFALLVSAVSFFIMIFYTDVALIPPLVASNALLVAKIWDIINDPLFGWASDKTKSKLGRRRVYLLFGALPLAIFTFLLWSVPSSLSPAMAFVWILVTYVLYDTFFTITQVPYFAMSAELTDDYDERTSLNAYIGTAAAIGFTIGSVVMRIIVESFESARMGYLVAGAVFGAIVGICVGVVAWKVKNPESKAVTNFSVLKAVKSTLVNKPFVYLLSAFGLARLSFTIITTMLAYFVTYYFMQEKSLTLLIGVLMLFTIAFIFFWKKVADKKSKAKAYGYGLGLAGLFLIMSFWIPQSNFFIYIIFVAAIGFALASHYVIPLAMVPDVVEEDELKTGQRLEGMYFGIYGLIDKIMRAIGIVIPGWVLYYFGYMANEVQSEFSLFGIKLFMTIVPGVLLFLALPFLFKYPITRERHKRMVKKLSK